MRVFYRGFNLYCQFPASSEKIVNNFIDRIFKGAHDIEFGHSFSGVRYSNDLILYGPRVININPDIVRMEEKVEDVMDIFCTDDSLEFLSRTGCIFYYSVEDGMLKVEPGCWISLKEKIVKVATTTTHSFLFKYTEKGNLYITPFMEKHQCIRVPNVIDIKCGREHCLLLDKDGNVYSFGSGSRGQLGHATLEEVTDEPKIIDALAGLKMVAIAAGGWHSCAISEAGDLYMWGWNGNGQLGLGKEDPAVMAIPTLIDFNGEVNVSKVACGTRHTIVILDNKRLFGCGWNKYKQLIDDEKENFPTMTYLHDFSDQDIIGLRCGTWSSAVLCKA